MADDAPEKKSNAPNIAAWVAIVGALVSVITLYFARHDKGMENRPILEVTEVKALAGGANGSRFEYKIQITITNTGNRSAIEGTINPPHGKSFLVGHNFGEVRSGQTIQVEMFWSDPEMFPEELQPNFTLKYRDRLEYSRTFTEYECFEWNFNDSILKELHDITPPVILTPCSTERLRQWEMDNK
jgi:hypothetical protein